MPRKVGLILEGDKALIKKFQRLGTPRKARKVLRKGTTSSGTIVTKAVRKIWRDEAKDTGLSAKSVDKKIIRGKTGFTAIIGVDRKAVGVRSDGRKHVPSNIDHLVEQGYQLKSGKTVPAVAPLRRGYLNSRTAAAEEFARKAGVEIEKEMLKK